jgi:glucose-1-phosphate cytidylyltransferase
MKTILLAGGLGTRLSEETAVKPKPMVEIGGIPMVVHIMSIYAAHGYDDFVIACGYRGDYIKEYFSNYEIKHSDWSINLASGLRTPLRTTVPNWNVSVIDTGSHTMTGGRIRRLQPLVGEETFMVTYGDGVADIDIAALVAFHREHGRLATLTVVRPPARFGCVELDGPVVRSFAEKPQVGEGWINGGFFVFEPGVFVYIADDTTVLEREPLEKLALDGQLGAYRHYGFWQPMDTIRDRHSLEALWAGGNAPWKKESTEHDHLRVLPQPEGSDHRPHRVQRHLAG